MGPYTGGEGVKNGKWETEKVDAVHVCSPTVSQVHNQSNPTP